MFNEDKVTEIFYMADELCKFILVGVIYANHAFAAMHEVRADGRRSIR